MSAANLDEIKKKYNFKEISVATWRDPSLSVHPVRGGPDSPRNPRFELGGFYVPRLKGGYDSDSATDDEESVVGEIENDDDGDRDEASIDLGLEEPLNDLLEFEQQPDTSIGDQVEQEEEPEIEIRSHESEETETRDQPPEFEEIDEQSLNPPDIDAEPDMAKEDSANEDDTAINMPDDDDHSQETGGADLIDISPFGDAAEADAAPPSDTGSDERRVSFAPGTPDPKPTPRKKKAATGTKKKKKRIAVPIDSLPADVMAMIDGAFEGLPPPPPPPPAPEAPLEDDFVLDDGAKDLEETDRAVDQDVPPLEEPAVEDAPATASSDEPTIEKAEDLPIETPTEPAQEDPPGAQETEQPPEAPAEPAAPEEAPADEPVVETVEEAPVVIEKSSKKKSSKSGKDKDKTKKKSSKTKSRDISPPPLGLDIDLLPPPPPPPPVMEDVKDDGKTPASAEMEETAADVQPAEDSERTADPGIDNKPQDTPAAENVAETTPDEPLADETSNENESGKIDEGMDDVDQDPGQNNDITEHHSAPEQKEDANSVPDAWDEADIVDESFAAQIGVKNEPEAEVSSPAESAPSPVDSGIEFDDDGSKPADEQIDAGASVPIEEAAKESEPVADKEAANASTSTGESGDQEERPAAEVSATEAAGAGEDQPSSEAVEPEDEGTQQNSGEGAAEEAADSPGAPASTDPEALETSKEDTNADESSSEPPAESNPERASTEEPAGNAEPAEAHTEAAGGESEAKAIVEDTALATEDVAADGETAGYEPPTVESASEEGKVNPFEFEAVAEPEATTGAELEQETTRELESTPEAPPSPVLSKSDSQGSHKHKADHWARKHADNPLKEVFEDAKVLERTHGSKSGKDELRVRDRHRKSRRMSSSGEDEGERRRRRAARKEAERKEAEAARLTEELRRRDEEGRKYQERRAAKQRAAEESAAQRDVEVRQRHRERDMDRGEGRNARPLKTTLPFALPAIPKALNLTSGASVHGTSVIRSHGGAYRPAAKETARQAAPISAPRDETETKPASREAKDASPPSSGGEKSPHRHRHRRHRSDGDRSSRNGKESDRHHRRPVLVEERAEARPRSFLGFVKI